MTTATCSNRPRRYQTGRGLWLKPLRVLARYAWTDAAIAFALSRLSRAALLRIMVMDDPSDRDIEDLIDRDGNTLAGAWTPRMVRHHRRARGITSLVRHETCLAKWWARGIRMRSDETTNSREIRGT